MTLNDEEKHFVDKLGQGWGVSERGDATRRVRGGCRSFSRGGKERELMRAEAKRMVGKGEVLRKGCV